MIAAPTARLSLGARRCRHAAARGALITGVVLAIGGCGSSHTAAPGPGPTGAQARSGAGSGSFSVQLSLHGGRAGTVTGCGASHHGRLYGSGEPVRLAGTVAPVPSTGWKVKLRVKACKGGAYVSRLKLKASRERHRGTFTATLPALGPGLFWVRATVIVAGATAGESHKRHFSVR